jgi:hypothetical protein
LEAIIEENKKEYPFLESHLQYLFVKERELTGVGLYVNFGYVKNEALESDVNILLSSSKSLTSPNLKHEIAYVLDVEKGKIKYLEIVTNGEDFLNAEDIQNLKLQ